jgi:benzoyl-CoA reductase/2-hydroxyglutaryl-CoA dehydratase subunit BcrC/BadD/HgdB
MRELLKLCGFSAHDLESEFFKVERAFNKLGITAEDIERAKQRLNTYYDIELRGIRKALRLCIREVVNAVLAREEGKKVLYGFMSTQFGWVISSALVSKSQKVYSAPIDMLFPFVFGCIFGKMVPVLEAAEQKWLKAGRVAHCGNVKSIVGLFILDLLPKPDLLVASGFNCETAPKTLYMLRGLYDIPVYQFGACQDREFGEPIDTRTTDFAEKSLRELVEKVQEVVGFRITDDMLREVIYARRGLSESLGKLSSLVHNSDPLLLRPTNDIIWTVLFELALSIDSMPEAIDAINTTYEELQERASKGLGVLEKGAPRIIATLPMHQSDPRLEHLVNELGVALVPASSPGPPSASAMKGVSDPYVAMSGGGGSLPMGAGLRGKIPAFVEGCKRMNIDGLLDRFHAGCRMTVADAIIIKDAVEKEAGIPVLLLEWENFDPRVYDHAQYKWQLEVFKTMLIERSA